MNKIFLNNITEFISKNQVFEKIGGAILISMIETLGHKVFKTLEPKQFGMLHIKHSSSQQIIEVLQDTINHLPLGVICILSCAGSIGKTKTYIYLIIGLALHFAYESNGKTDQNMNILITALLGELSAYVYNHKILNSSKSNI